MNREYGYQWSQIWTAVVAVPAVAGYVIWRQGELDRPDVIIFIIIAIGMVIHNAIPMAKVLVTKSHVLVSFLLPFRKGGQFAHDDIESYAELAMQRKDKRIPVAGLLQPRGSKRIMIMGAGTRDFKEMNSLFLKMFPRPKETEPEVGQVSSEAAPSAPPDEPST
jgi:hypothetical protein